MVPPADLAEAARLHSRGDLQGARRAAEAAVSRRPDDLNALRFAGTLACQIGDLARGTTLLGQALAQLPSDESTRVNLVQALIQSGDWNGADRIAAQAPQPTADLLLLRAMAARNRGKSDLAARLLHAVLQARPNDVVALNNLGNIHLDAGRLDEAEQAFAQAYALRPSDTAIQVNLGRVRSLRGNREGGLAVLQAAAAAAPDDPQLLFTLAQALTEVERWAEALPVLGTAARLDRQNPALFTLMGVAFEHLGDREKAEQAYRFAIRTEPTHAPALLNLGILLEGGNRLDELRALLGLIEEHGVACAEARYLRALLLRREGRNEEALTAAEAADDNGAVAPNMRHSLLGQLADRLGQPDRAFAEFTAMHQAMASGGTYSGEEGWREVAEWTDELAARLDRGWPSVDVPGDPPAPAFLIGFMRSGTTLLDTMLMGHSGTHVLEELPIMGSLARRLGTPSAAADVASPEAVQLRDAYFAELQRLASPPRGKLVIDKFPMAGLHAPLIHRLFPQARIIFSLRHPCDVVLSCFMQNFRLSKTMASFLTIENAARYYDAVMRFWTLARERLPLSVHTVRYEALLDDRESELRHLTDFLGLAWEQTLLDHQRTAAERGYIRTPSYHQVTEGIYRGASGRWQRYAEQMAPALPILAPWVERFGYEPIPNV